MIVLRRNAKRSKVVIVLTASCPCHRRTSEPVIDKDKRLARPDFVDFVGSSSVAVARCSETTTVVIGAFHRYTCRASSLAPCLGPTQRHAQRSQMTKVVAETVGHRSRPAFITCSRQWYPSAVNASHFGTAPTRMLITFSTMIYRVSTSSEPHDGEAVSDPSDR